MVPVRESRDESPRHTNLAHLGGVGLLACALDESAEITDGQVEGEVD